jgi:hypothetical protein
MQVDHGHYDRAPIASTNRGDQMFQTIVVGTDGSETARKAVREAVALANSVGASVGIVSA